MKLRIAFFILSVAAMAAFGLFTQARAAGPVIINNYAAPPSHFCVGLIACMMQRQWELEDRQAQGPHACNVWNGRTYVRGTCQ